LVGCFFHSSLSHLLSKALIVGFLLLLLLKKKKEEGLAKDYLKQARKDRAPFSLLTCLVLCELGFFLGGLLQEERACEI
jgi:hypothetical protein